MIRPEFCPVMFGCSCKGQRQTQRIKCAVGDQEGREHVRVDVWLELERFPGLELLQRDMTLLAAFDELLGVLQVAVLDRNEHPAVWFDDLRNDPAQDHVLVDAFHRRFLILHRIAPAAVQQAVGASGCPMAEIAAFDDGHLTAAQCQIVRGGYAGKSCSDDDDMGFTH
jgi:hypothetical protein